MHGLVLSYNVSFFFRQCTSVLQYFLSVVTFHRPFLCQKSTRFKLTPQSPVFFACNSPLLSFNLLICCLLGQEPCHLQGPEFVSTSCHALLCPLAPASNSSSVLVPFSVVRKPSIFLHQIKNFSLPIHSSFHVVSSHLLLSPSSRNL